jgi:hypothetical protein
MQIQIWGNFGFGYVSKCSLSSGSVIFSGISFQVFIQSFLLQLGLLPVSGLVYGPFRE